MDETGKTDEKLRLVGGQYRRERGRLRGTVKVWFDDHLRFSDNLYLDGAKYRREFAKQAIEMLKDDGPGIKPEEIERRLLGLLEKAGEELASGSPNPDTGGDPEEIDGRPMSRNGYCRILASAGGYVLARLKTVEGVEIPAQMCSFDAWIAEEILVDEEAGPPHLQYRVCGTGEYGRSLPEVMITAEQFDRLDWVSVRWGVEATVFAQQREHVAVAIKRLSRPDVPRRAIFGHTGFRQVDGQRVFLHAGGAIGPNGPVPEIEVVLPEKLSRYALPHPPANPVLALRYLFGLLGVTDRHVMLVLLVLLLAAPLDSSMGAITSLILLGNTGMKKSTLVALLLHLYGGPFTAQSPVTTWEDTPNALEKLGHQAKDLPLWVDDIRPPATRREREQQQQALQRMLRGATTRSGRGRLRADLKAAPVYHPRGPLVTTAEHLPEISSTLARTLVDKMEPVSLKLLTQAQTKAPELLPQVGAAWVQFLAGELDTLAPLLTSEAQKFRDGFIKKYPDLHGGVGDAAGRLAAAGRTFLAFAGASGALSEDEVGALMEELVQALETTALDTSEFVMQARPSLAFMEAMRALLDTKRVVIEGITQATVLSVPAHSAELLGWTVVTDEEGKSRHERAPGAVTVGWLDHVGDLIYLDPTVALHEVLVYTRDARAGVPFNGDAVYRELDGQGLLARKGKHQHTVVKKIGHQAKRVLALKAAALLGGAGTTGNSDEGTQAEVENEPDGNSSF